MRPSATNSKLGLGEACPILVGFCKPYRFAIWGVLVLGVVSACLEGIGLGLMVPVLQNLTGEGSVRTGNALALLRSNANTGWLINNNPHV